MTLIRPAVPNDVDAIARVHIDSWLTTYRGLIPDAVLDNLSFERRRDWWQGIVSGLQKIDVVVVDDDGQVAGFAYFGAEH
ncbi:MAG: GNAT family N-acetyltransferase, partial [Chloroflexi bacterium]|nr:GNAT family N-acetyltransferase [Chloroflexota bacterium]